jgi:acetolactate synthase II small subunit
MNHSLKLQLHQVDGALVRVIGVTERRGWCTTGRLASTAPDEGALDLQLSVLGDRSIDLLVRQLARLHVVQSVELAS